jgi:hypothetical protein
MGLAEPATLTLLRMMTGDLPSRVVAGMAFVQRAGGGVKLLSGFKKSHHTVPDAANPTTNAFLGKLCAEELAAEAEALFQSVRTGLSYKRKDVALTVSSPTATLVAKDFVVDFLYRLEEAQPSRYATSTTLHSLRNVELARTEEFSAIFNQRFTELAFAFRKGAQVESIIDAIESVGAEHGLVVDYPSDCRTCEIKVEGVDAVVRCNAGGMDILFPRAGSPRDLIESFTAVRHAFAMSKVLAGFLS